MSKGKTWVLAVAVLAVVALLGAVPTVRADTIGSFSLANCGSPGTNCPAATYTFDITSTSATLTIDITGAVNSKDDEITAADLGFTTGTASFGTLNVAVTLNGGAVSGWTAFLGPLNNSGCQNVTSNSICASGLVDIAQGDTVVFDWTWSNAITIFTDPSLVHTGANYGPNNGEIVSFTGAGAPVPEPATLMTLGSGLLALGGFFRRRLGIGG